MYGRINVVNLFFLLLIFTMNPIIIAYIFKYNYYLNILLVSLINIIFFYYIIKNKLILHIPRFIQVILYIHILITLNTLLMYQKITHGLLFFTFFIELLILSYVLINDVEGLIKKITFIIKTILVLNLIVFVAVNILKLPYSQIILSINGEYIRHHFMYLAFVLDHQENFLGWSFHRVHSYFTEPAQFSTFLVFFILILKMNNYRGSFKLFWINGFLSFSMMFYVFFLLYLFFKIFWKIKSYHVIFILFLLQITISILLLNYIGLKDFAIFMSVYIDASNSFLMKAGSIIARLEFFLNNINSGIFYPLGIGYADNIDQQELLFNNTDEKSFVGIRSATGLLGNIMAIGGILTLFYFMWLTYTLENKFKNKLEVIVLLKAALVLFSLLSTSGLYSPIVAILIGITSKNILQKNG